MAKGPSDYETGTERALFRLSKGTCYYPGCEVPIMSLVEGHAIIGVQIAHIRGANANSARYDESMTDDERRAFSNLMLMCVPHHNLIDRLEPENHPVALLEDWKRANEPDEGFSILAPRLTEAALVSILEDFTQRNAPLREVSVAVLGGIVTHQDGVTAGPLSAIPVLLEHNPELRDRELVVIADISSVGTIPVVIDAVDFTLRVTVPGNEDLVELPYLGRNDFSGSNPPLPYRLQDGGSVQWFIKVSSLLLPATALGGQLVELRAVVRLGSGEHIESAFVEWPTGLKI